ncbi:MAG: DUF5683 domain-containing protein [bacterium]
MRSRRALEALGLGLGLAALLAPVAPVAAQAVHREGRALEFRSDLAWARLTLRGDDDIIGLSPLRVPGPLVGDFWLVADGPGVERQRGRVRVGLDEAGSRLESYGSPTFHEKLMRSVVFPGYAQLRSGDHAKGALLAVAGAGGVAAAAWAQSKFWDADDAVTQAQAAVAAAGSASERQARRLAFSDAQEAKTYASNRRNLYLGAAATAWGIGALDALAFGPSFHVTQADEAGLTLALHKKSRKSAMIRGIIFPGLGQEYNGRPRKAFVLASAGIGLGVWYLKAQDDFNQAVSDFERVRQRFEASTSVEERTALLAQEQSRFADVDSRERSKNVAMDSLAGLWILSLVDAAIDFGGGWGGDSVSKAKGGLGLYMDPSGVVGARMRF